MPTTPADSAVDAIREAREALPTSTHPDFHRYLAVYLAVQVSADILADAVETARTFALGEQ